jgi:hypothetical protein
VSAERIQLADGQKTFTQEIAQELQTLRPHQGHVGVGLSLLGVRLDFLRLDRFRRDVIQLRNQDPLARHENLGHFVMLTQVL